MERLDADYWTARWRENQTGWDIGQVSTPLKAYFDQLTDKNASILIPGCGNAWEARYLLDLGFTNLTLIDISPALVDRLRTDLKEGLPAARIICGDFFQLEGRFDLIIEQTFFCALEPALRPAFVKKAASLLSDDGKLVGVLFDRAFEGGPPFGGTREEYRELFAPYFEIVKMEDCYNSIAPRRGTELFVQLRVKQPNL